MALGQRNVAVALMAAALFSAPLHAQDAPWDFTESEPVVSSVAVQGLFEDLFEHLLLSYRQNKEETSIHRCLFEVSCSHFAERAFLKRGPLSGSVLFVDRYFFRENFAARALYPLAAGEDGAYHLDDAFFLP